MKGLRIGIAAAVLAAGIAAPAPARAGFIEDAGWGSLTVLSNILYMPAKVVYSVVGGLTGSLAWACTLGDTDLANKIWVTSMGGTYVVTPRMLQGQDAFEYAGSTDSSRAADHGPTLQEQGLSGS